MKEQLGFFINHVFVGVFQYDSGTPKHALELKKGLKILYFCICVLQCIAPIHAIQHSPPQTRLWEETTKTQTSFPATNSDQLIHQMPTLKDYSIEH